MNEAARTPSASELSTQGIFAPGSGPQAFQDTCNALTPEQCQICHAIKTADLQALQTHEFTFEKLSRALWLSNAGILVPTETLLSWMNTPEHQAMRNHFYDAAQVAYTPEEGEQDLSKVIERRILLDWALMLKQPDAVIDALIKAYLSTFSEDYDIKRALVCKMAKCGHLPRLCALLTAAERSDDQYILGEMTLLHLAARYGYKEMVEYLLSREKIPINVQTQFDNVTPLGFAARFGQVASMVALFNRSELDANAVDSGGETALIMAVSFGCFAAVNYLLTQQGVEVNRINENGFSALSLAAHKGYSRIVALLLAHRDINVNHIQTYTALHQAILASRDDCVRLLLASKEINVNLADRNICDSPLHYAIQQKNRVVIDLLLASGKINLNKLNREYEGALHFAVRSQELDLLALLLAQPRIELSPWHPIALTPLQLAKEIERADMVEMIEAAVAQRAEQALIPSP